MIPFPGIGVFLQKLVAALILPPIGPMIGVLLAILIARRFQRVGRALFVATFLFVFGASLPAVANWLQTPFEEVFPVRPVAEMAKDTQAIVVLGGGRELGAQEYGGETLRFRTLERVRYAARLGRQTGLPILVSGGKPDGGNASEALLMAQSLRDDFGVTARWVEGDSANTIENAMNSSRLLQAANVKRIILVTDVMHMARAKRDFEVRKIDVVAAATGYRARTPLSWMSFIPESSSYNQSCYLLHESLGIVWTRLIDDPYRSR